MENTARTILHPAIGQLVRGGKPLFYIVLDGRVVEHTNPEVLEDILFDRWMDENGPVPRDGDAAFDTWFAIEEDRNRDGDR
jgi:hypothetical protein